MNMLHAGMPRGADTRDEDEEAEHATAVFVKYNRLLHGEKKVTRHTKRDKLTTKFLKKYIHYAKSRIMPVLTEEVCCTNINSRNQNAASSLACSELLWSVRIY